MLLKGNNTEIIKQIPNNSFDLTVTSPPYDNLREYKSGCCFDFETLAKELKKELEKKCKTTRVVIANSGLKFNI